MLIVDIAGIPASSSYLLVVALRISSTWSEAVTAVSIAIGTLVAIIQLWLSHGRKKPQKNRRRVKLWLAFGMCLSVAIAGLVVTLVRSSHSPRGQHLSKTTSSRQPTAAPPTDAELAQRAKAAQHHHVQLHQQRQLATFIQAAMQQPVNCTPNEHLSSTVAAQQACHFGNIEAVYTRLGSVDETRSFFKARYLNSFPFSGYDGAHCGNDHSTIGGSWHNGYGVPQGSWVFRTSGSDVVLLWEYRSHRVVVRASQSTGVSVNQLCELWYRHSGETP